MRELGEAERLQERREVDAEAAAVALLDAVPPAHRVVQRSAPGLDAARRGRLLLIGPAEVHPATLGLEPGVEVVDGPEVVAELGAAHLADERRRVGRLIAPHLVRRAARRSHELPWIVTRPAARHVTT